MSTLVLKRQVVSISSVAIKFCCSWYLYLADSMNISDSESIRESYCMDGFKLLATDMRLWTFSFWSHCNTLEKKLHIILSENIFQCRTPSAWQQTNVFSLEKSEVLIILDQKNDQCYTICFTFKNQPTPTLGLGKKKGRRETSFS